MDEIHDRSDSKWSKWVKRFGAGAFLFFLVKGLIWLGVFAAGAYYAKNALSE